MSLSPKETLTIEPKPSWKLELFLIGQFQWVNCKDFFIAEQQLLLYPTVKHEFSLGRTWWKRLNLKNRFQFNDYYVAPGKGHKKRENIRKDIEDKFAELKLDPGKAVPFRQWIQDLRFRWEVDLKGKKRPIRFTDATLDKIYKKLTIEPQNVRLWVAKWKLEEDEAWTA
jgi:hypothetical protein